MSVPQAAGVGAFDIAWCCVVTAVAILAQGVEGGNSTPPPQAATGTTVIIELYKHSRYSLLFLEIDPRPCVKQQLSPPPTGRCPLNYGEFRLIEIQRIVRLCFCYEPSLRVFIIMQNCSL